VAVPSVIGAQVDEAEERLRRFRVERREVPSVRAAGVVLDQNPRAPAQRAAGALVRIDVSDGSRVLVPPVRQRRLADARARLTTNGLGATVVERESDDSPGVVAEQDPPGGTEVVRGSTVELVVSTGVAVPNVKGETLDEARRRLVKFKVVAAEVESGELKGSVVEQDPPPATRAAAGTRIVINVSDGVLVAVPDLQSTTLSFARATLQEAGLGVLVRTWPDHADAVVKAQSPAARAVVRRGTSVELDVRPPPAWVAGAGAGTLLIAGLAGWSLWRRPRSVSKPPEAKLPPPPVRAVVEIDPARSESRIDGAAPNGPTIRLDVHLEPGSTTVKFREKDSR
jgi:beta-lactam-binding protein with PASTA domain